MTTTEWVAVLGVAPGLVTGVLIVVTYLKVRRIGEQVAELHRDLEGNGYTK